MTLRAVAWDIDGTLVDSEPLHHEALLAVCAGLGTDLSDLSDVAFRGVHMGDVWTALAPRLPEDTREDEWLAAINRYYVAHRASLKPIPGAVETVKALSARGVPQVCVSNSNRSIVDANLEAIGVLSAMSFTISLDDVMAGKPDPEPYRTAAERLGLQPESVIAIEDSRTGAISARAAGLFVVGYEAESGIIPAAHLCVEDLAEVLNLI